MTFREYIYSLKAFARENPKSLNMQVFYKGENEEPYELVEPMQEFGVYKGVLVHEREMKERGMSSDDLNAIILS